MLRSLIIAFLLGFAVIANSNAQIVAPGASSTAGYGVGASSAYPAQLEAILRARGRAMSVSNAGISGDTTGGMLARLSSAVPEGTKIVTPAAFAPSKPMAMFSLRFEAGTGSPTEFI
jgi:acyl-CoA thioesterase-1